MGFKIKSIFGGGPDSNQSGPNQPEATPPQPESTTEEQIDVQPEAPQSVASQPSKSVERQATAEPVTEESQSAPEAAEAAAEEEVQEQKKPAPRRKPRNQDELFLEAIPERANNAPEHLKSILQGKILIEILPSNKKFLIDCHADQPCTVTEMATAVAADCTIALHGKDLMRISDGDLNPQILMLSHKAKVWGNPKLATYVFNLIAPQNNNL